MKRAVTAIGLSFILVCATLATPVPGHNPREGQVLTVFHGGGMGTFNRPIDNPWWEGVVGWLVAKVLDYAASNIQDPCPPANNGGACPANGAQGATGGGGGDGF